MSNLSGNFFSNLVPFSESPNLKNNDILEKNIAFFCSKANLQSYQLRARMRFRNLDLFQDHRGIIISMQTT